MQNISYCQSCKLRGEIKEECALDKCEKVQRHNDPMDKAELQISGDKDKSEKTRTISILGKTVTVKNYICSHDGVNYKEKPENVQLQLFVNMLTFCPASCRFCVAKNTKQDKKIDIDKFAYMMKLLKAEDRIRGIKITGGEPFYDIDLLNEVISVIYDIFGYEMEVSISTNGIGLEHLKKIKDLEHIEAIHLSRHHYDDNVNRVIFGEISCRPFTALNGYEKSLQFKYCFDENGASQGNNRHEKKDFIPNEGDESLKVRNCLDQNGASQGNSGHDNKGLSWVMIPGKDMLKKIVNSISYKDIFVLNCILLKDYINSPDEAHKFMDFAIDLGIPKVGFATCSPVNKYAEEQSIPYESVIKENDPALLFTRGFFDYEYCHCTDGVYLCEDGRIVEFYGKSTKMEEYAYCRGLVYDSDNHLKDGFGGKILA